jgi:hypothetical protein
VVDIFDEVSDDLRADRAVALAKRYGGLLFLAMIAVLIGVGGQQGWIWYQGKQSGKAATAYLALIGPIDAQGPQISTAQQISGAQSLAQFAASAPEGYKTLGLLRAAALYNGAGQSAQALSLWNQVAGDAGADVLLRDLANLYWAQNALGQAPDADVLARLQPLAWAQNPYHGLAQETQALVYLHQGKADLAKALLTQIVSDPNNPEGVQQRAGLLLAKLNG